MLKEANVHEKKVSTVLKLLNDNIYFCDIAGVFFVVCYNNLSYVVTLCNIARVMVGVYVVDAGHGRLSGVLYRPAVRGTARLRRMAPPALMGQKVDSPFVRSTARSPAVALERGRHAVGVEEWSV